MSAFKEQEGGDHYKSLEIQPVEYNHRNRLGFMEGSVVKYVTRWQSKGGILDLKKARHFLDLLIEMEENIPKKKDKIEVNEPCVIEKCTVGYVPTYINFDTQETQNDLDLP